MPDLINLDAYRPHTLGTLVCLACGHLWEGCWQAGPTPPATFECPKCDMMTGINASVMKPEQILSTAIRLVADARRAHMDLLKILSARLAEGDEINS
jgi:hypothetical protein